MLNLIQAQGHEQWTIIFTPYLLIMQAELQFTVGPSGCLASLIECSSLTINLCHSLVLVCLVNPRRACAARVTVVVLCVCVCVCVCVHGSNLLVAQLRDKLTGSVSWSLQNKFGVFRFVSIAFPYLRVLGNRPFFTRPAYYARDFTTSMYAHV